MAVIKLVENYAVAQLRKDVRDSLMMAGEQAILLQLFHAGDVDAVRCEECGDDVYHSAEADCRSCYGTTFQGGVRQAVKIWTLFTDDPWDEKLTPHGTYVPYASSVQMEALPVVLERDIVVRVSQWNSDGSPMRTEGFWSLGPVNRRSLRTGNRYNTHSSNQVGQASAVDDVVGQRAQASQVAVNALVTHYPIVGVQFPENSFSTYITRTGSALP